MTIATTVTPGTKVEIGSPGTPSYRVGRLVSIASAKALGRHEDEPSALVTWESGEEEWTELSLLRVAS
jgi:hypothetical protein